MFHIKRKIYESVPTATRRLMRFVPFTLATGRLYRDTVALCRRQDRMSRQEVLASQEAALGRLLEFAVHEVPFYRPRRRAVERYRPFDALKEFPRLTKQDVLAHYGELTADCLDRIPCHRAVTGGSSGQQLSFLEDDATCIREMGFMYAQWRRVGYTHRCRRVTFRGVPIGRKGRDALWQRDWLKGELQFSPFHLSDEKLPLYIDKIRQYRPQFIHGYPSVVAVLAEYVLRHELVDTMRFLQGTLLGSEGCSDSQRDRIGRAFGGKVYTWYGHSERTVLGGECEQSRHYHQFPAYGVLEIVKDDGSPCEVGESGEIVGTGFLNRAMPLIRYRTDDFAVRCDWHCECGRAWDRFSHVIGRRSIEGFVFGRHGARISAAALNTHSDIFENVVRYQYYQTEPGELEIRVIANSRYSAADEKKIVNEHKRKMGSEMDVIVRSVDDIPLTQAGKQRRILCEIEKD